MSADQVAGAGSLPGQVNFAVVGAGIIGLAVARQVLVERPGASVCVIDKEETVGTHQTGHNSGVVHAGLYYKPGSAKARFCRRGGALLREYCAQKGLVYDACGKLVVALDREQEAQLPAMLERASSLGVPGLHIVGSGGIRELEPHVSGHAALVSPSTAIVDYGAVTRAYAADVVAAGGQIVLGTAVVNLTDHADAARVVTSRGTVRASQVALCAGLQADRLDRRAGGSREPQIMPFRGEYFQLREPRASLIRSLVYPVPDPRYPFLGVHFTKRVSGAVDVGPNAVLALAREGYRWRDVRLRDLAEMAGYGGTWRLAHKNIRAGAHEMLGSISRRAYARRARAYVPELRAADLVTAPAGVRAQAVGADGSLIDDFVLRHHDRVLAVRNAPSPAATSSLAIAEHVVDQLASGNTIHPLL